MNRARTFLAIGVALLFARAEASAQSATAALKDRAVEIANKFQDAVVTVKVALKQKMLIGGQEMSGEDAQVEVTGTVVDPSGLVVVSDSQLDPSSLMMEMMLGSMGGGGPQFEVQTEIREVKIVLKDGKEAPGRVVLRDKDLDLAFVAPQEKGKYTHVPLAKGNGPDLFDEMLVLGRLGRNLDRTPSVTAIRVRAVVKRPRTFYVGSDPLGALTGGLGSPVFDGAGRPIGLLLMRRGPKVRGEGSGLSALLGQMVPVVLPAEDIADLMTQAIAEAKKASEEPAGGEKKPEGAELEKPKGEPH
jgi:hypothetical protein